MHRFSMSRRFRMTFAGLVLLSMGAHHPLPSAEIAQGLGDLDSVLPSLIHVEEPPKSVAETKTWLKLQEIVTMNFPEGTSLKDFIRLIRESTRDTNAGFPRGIPVYISPQDLNDADLTMESKVTIDLDGMPLGKSLRLALKQLGLEYRIDKDGLLVIRSTGCYDGEPVPDDFASWQSLDMLREEIRALRDEVRSLRREKFEPPGQAPENVPPIAPAPAGGTGGGFR